MPGDLALRTTDLDVNPVLGNLKGEMPIQCNEYIVLTWRSTAKSTGQRSENDFLAWLCP